ncbi:MAG TPA: sigma-54 dependent transcriptional regulator [Bacteroidia bacterium]|nr:sigma-54 dependent transcriptional regulator [Bacteroidia bacterium]
MAKIFVIEDDAIMARVITQSLEKLGTHEIKHFTNGEDCINNLHENPDIVTIDYNLPGMDGLTLMNKIKTYSDTINMVIVSGQESVEVVVEAYRNGAKDYVLKNDNMYVGIENSVRNLLQNVNLRKEVETLQEQIIDRNRYNHIVGNSAQILKTLRLIQKVEKSTMTVLVTGQSGTGKELVAKAIHYNSPRARKPFVIVNMGAIPQELIESELFGHEKGAFTDAREKRIGKFEEANDGTIFLDEIGEMDLGLQTKLLRVLQEKEITRIGSNKIIKLDFRMVAATNKNLALEVKEGRFREDLFYRLQGFLIHLPPLCERGDDILLLAKFFLNQFCTENKVQTKTISNQVAKTMLEYAWPGNIRELKAVIERAALLCEGDTITEDDVMFATA